MAWEDRVRQGEYTSPNGESFQFEFISLARDISKKIAEKALPGFDNDDLQDLGNRSITLPMEIFFTGVDYDLTADRFWDALRQSGRGTLKHPRWGDLPVLPISVKQSENLVDRARRADFTVSFKVVPELTFPVADTQIQSDIETDLEEADIALAESFGEKINFETIEDKAESEQFFVNMASAIESNLRPLIEDTDAVLTAFDTTLNTIETSIDDLLDEPVLLAQNFIRLTKLPARAESQVQAKVNGYNAVFDTLFNDASPINSDVNSITNNQLRNHFISQELLGFSTVGGVIESTLNTEYSPQLAQVAVPLTNTDQLNDADTIIFTKAQVLALVDSLIALFTDLVNNLDSREQELESETIDKRYTYSGDVLSLVKNGYANTNSLLINKAFTLAIEKRFTLRVERTPLDLVHELYGSIDFIDFFISSNSLSDSAVLLIPKGTEILYYE
jgi:prophage DNA circulation protein